MTEVKACEGTLVELIPSTISFMGGAQIRMIGTSEDPWFNGNDLASFLKYTNPSQAIRKHVDSMDKSSLSSVLSGCREIHPGNYTPNELASTYVNEAGIYSLALGSKLPAAKAFKRWVIGDLLPSLRKTGEYRLTTQLQTLTSELANQLLLTDRSTRIAEEQKKIAADAQFKAEVEQKQRENAESTAAEANKRADDEKLDKERISAESDAKLKAAATELEEAKKKTTRVNAHIELTQEYHELGTFYINTCLDDHDKKIYKPGHCASIEIKSFRERLSNYNVRGTDRTLYFPVYIRHVYNAHQFDARVKAAISLFKSNKNKEILVIDLDDLIEICEYLAMHNNDDMEYINKFAKERFVQGIARPVKEIKPVVIEPVVVPPMKKKLVTEFTREELMQTATNAIEEYMRKQKDDASWSISRGLASEKITWMDISETLMSVLDVKRAKLCANVWTKLFKELAALHKFQFIHRKVTADESPISPISPIITILPAVS